MIKRVASGIALSALLLAVGCNKKKKKKKKLRYIR